MAWLNRFYYERDNRGGKFIGFWFLRVFIDFIPLNGVLLFEFFLLLLNLLFLLRLT